MRKAKKYVVCIVCVCGQDNLRTSYHALGEKFLSEILLLRCRIFILIGLARPVLVPARQID
jgi:hypothetical protein